MDRFYSDPVLFAKLRQVGIGACVLFFSNKILKWFKKKIFKKGTILDNRLHGMSR